MSSHAVRMKVVAPVSFECSFWMEDDGWKGLCEMFSLVAYGTSFEEAKTSLSMLLKEKVEAVLGDLMKDVVKSKAEVIPFPTERAKS